MRDYNITALQQSYNSLHLTLSHFHYGALRGYSGCDTIYDSRLYFIPKGQGDKHATITNLSNPSQQEPIALAGDRIYFMPRDAPVAYSFPKGFQLVAIHFGLTLFPGYDAFAGKTAFESRPDSNDLTARLQCILKLKQDIRQVTEVRGIIMQAVASFISTTTQEIKQLESVRAVWQPLLAKINDEPSAQLRINDLASLCGKSRDMLSKTFYRDIGMPLKTYMTRALVQRAAHQVLYSNKQIRQIARDLEFNDEYYFSRFFKKHVNMTPLQYRKTALL